MASKDSELLYCYNKGCGSKFHPNDNTQDSCCFHPGNPIFHDAYKSWSCCNKSSLDFNEFLNIKGCKKSFHSDIKPPEPQKPEKSKSNDVNEYKASDPKVSVIQRPPINSPLIKIQPSISTSLQSQLEKSLSPTNPESVDLNEIKIGVTCKNSGCVEEYKGSQMTNTVCVYHKGVPVFHEGMKFWSCCQKKTTDFTVFLEQAGCTVGEHVWLKDKISGAQSNIRYDWHQTGSYVFISVYAKMCNPNKSLVEINPIRVKIHLEFLVDNSCFDKDFELCGVVDVEKSGVSMMPTKVEVKLKKVDGSSWPKLYLSDVTEDKKEDKKGETVPESEEFAEDDLVDLKDIN